MPKVTVRPATDMPAPHGRGKWDELRARFQELRPGEAILVEPEDGEVLSRFIQSVRAASSSLGGASRIDPQRRGVWVYPRLRR
jgi:hypothetical protein